MRLIDCGAFAAGMILWLGVAYFMGNQGRDVFTNAMVFAAMVTIVGAVNRGKQL